MALCLIDISKLQKCAVKLDDICESFDSTFQSVAVCPQCGSYSVMVLETRSTKDHVIRRRRECMDCEHRYSAYEISAQDYEMLKRFKKLMAKGE